MSTYVTGTGQRITNVHSAKACAGQHCVIHNPSDHHMKDWPTHFRDPCEPFGMKPGLMERICKHRCGHPDPDSLAWFVAMGKEHYGIHGCCGCCNPEGHHDG